MRIAAVIHGNLRTFFMQLRGSESYELMLTQKQGYEDIHPDETRVCDVLFNSVIKDNNVDVFAVTDTTNFYYNGKQYTNSGIFGEQFCEDKPEDIELITRELTNLFGSHLKGLRVKTDDITNDEKVKILTDAKSGGVDPSKMVNQYIKIKHGYDMMHQYENDNGFQYDIVLKTRFDNLHGARRLPFENYDFENVDIYVPGGSPPFVYDWCGFGVRDAMELYNLYDKIGCTLDKRIYRSFCPTCNFYEYGDKVDKCPNGCGAEGFTNNDESTIASEHHLYRLFNDNGIRYKTSGYYSCPLRFNNGYKL